MYISCEITVCMQASCSKAASKVETCFPKLCLEPDDNAKRPGSRPGWLHIGNQSGLGIHILHQSTPVSPTSNITVEYAAPWSLITAQHIPQQLRRVMNLTRHKNVLSKLNKI